MPHISRHHQVKSFNLLLQNDSRMNMFLILVLASIHSLSRFLKFKWLVCCRAISTLGFKLKDSLGAWNMRWVFSSFVLSQFIKKISTFLLQSFAFVSMFMATLLEFISLILFHRAGLNHISVGPSALIFSVIYHYSRIVPAVYNFRIFGFPLINKSINYLAVEVCTLCAQINNLSSILKKNDV